MGPATSAQAVRPALAGAFASINARSERVRLLSIAAAAEEAFLRSGARFTSAADRLFTSASLALVASACRGPWWLVATFGCWTVLNAFTVVVRGNLFVKAYHAQSAAADAADATTGGAA